MATELTVQSERAFQKQPHIFLNSKRQSGKTKRVGKGGRRWYKDVGLGFRTPKNAIEGSYIGRSSPLLDIPRSRDCRDSKEELDSGVCDLRRIMKCSSKHQRTAR